MTYGTKKRTFYIVLGVFEMLSTNKIKLEINTSYNLSDVSKAHIDLELRKTFGSIVMKNDY